jgi:hypothetical protein
MLNDVIPVLFRLIPKPVFWLSSREDNKLHLSFKKKPLHFLCLLPCDFSIAVDVNSLHDVQTAIVQLLLGDIGLKLDLSLSNLRINKKNPQASHHCSVGTVSFKGLPGVTKNIV